MVWESKRKTISLKYCLVLDFFATRRRCPCFNRKMWLGVPPHCQFNKSLFFVAAGYHPSPNVIKDFRHPILAYSLISYQNTSRKTSTSFRLFQTTNTFLSPPLIPRNCFSSFSFVSQKQNNHFMHHRLFGKKTYLGLH